MINQDLIDNAYSMYMEQIENGERDINDTLNSFILDGFKGFNNMTEEEILEWIAISS